MKDSGIDWIGDIPKHWKISKLKFEGGFQAGISKDGSLFGYGSPFISYPDIYYSNVLKWTSNLVDSTRGDQVIFSVKKGDAFFTRTSETMDDIENASTCLETIPKATYTGFAIRFRTYNPELNPEYLVYFFGNREIRKYFHKYMNIVTRASLSQGKLKECTILIPPKQEQQQIAEYLDKHTSLIDRTIKKIEKNIKLLEEYKKSLIHHVVTGKVDVRAKA